MSKFSQLTNRLYTGEISYDLISRRRRWYILSAVLITVSVLALVLRGLTFGIEFRGGADFRAPAQVTEQTVDQLRVALEATGVPGIDEAIISTIGDSEVRVQTDELDPTEEVPRVRAAIGNEVGVPPDQVTYSLIGPSWGDQITDRALIALVVFLTLVSLVIGIYFRNWKMAAAALLALGHDLVLTLGIYALVGFTVTPATLIGVLTILGYSLYDTVVVFDKVRENTRDLKSSTTRTYSEAANLAVNQVLVRSINTTVIGVLPVAALLFAGGVILGEGPLKDLALALFVGMVSGAYSSIFIATPLLAQLKEREPDMKKLASRVSSRRAKDDQRSRGAVAEPDKPMPKPKPGPKPVPATATTASVQDDRVEEGEDGEGRAEPTNASDDAELADAAVSSRTGIRISRVESGSRPDLRPTNEGAAKRPQPQHKSRSQRKK